MTTTLKPILTTILVATISSCGGRDNRPPPVCEEASYCGYSGTPCCASSDPTISCPTGFDYGFAQYCDRGCCAFCGLYGEPCCPDERNFDSSAVEHAGGCTIDLVCDKKSDKCVPRTR